LDPPLRYCGGCKPLPRSFATSGIFSGSGTPQSMQRNFRPPVLTSINRIGLLHFGQIGGGVFLGMGYSTLDQAGALPNSLSPNTAYDRGGDAKILIAKFQTRLSGIGLKVFCFEQPAVGPYGSMADVLEGRQCPNAPSTCATRLPNVSGTPKILVTTKRKGIGRPIYRRSGRY
jgi:hypothetical protein